MIAGQLFPIDDDMLLEEVAQAALERGMYLIGNGQRIVASPVVPAGWHPIAVKIKTPISARTEGLPCAA